MRHCYHHCSVFFLPSTLVAFHPLRGYSGSRNFRRKIKKADFRAFFCFLRQHSVVEARTNPSPWKLFCIQHPFNENHEWPFKENFVCYALSKKKCYTTPFQFVYNPLSKKLFNVSKDRFWYNLSLIILILVDLRQNLIFDKSAGFGLKIFLQSKYFLHLGSHDPPLFAGLTSHKAERWEFRLWLAKNRLFLHRFQHKPVT